MNYKVAIASIMATFSLNVSGSRFGMFAALVVWL